MKNLIFDIDGTLWNTTGVVAKAWNEAVRRSNVPELCNLFITPKMLEKEFGKPMDEIADDLFGPIDRDAKAKLLEYCCELEHQAILDNFDDLSYEGMKGTMHELAKDHRLFIVSNCQTGYIELVIEKNGLEGLIEDYECFGKTGLQKSENIRLVIERNNLSYEESVYIGDTMGDFLSTKAAGIPFVHAAYGFGVVDAADCVIEKFSDLLTVV